MAGAIGSIGIYDKDGNKVFEALCSGGDGSYIISLNDNIVTIKNGTGSTGSLVYSVENPTINTQNITVVPTPSDYSVETVTVTLPYSPTKIKFFGGNSGFPESEYNSPLIVNQGETITATSENYMASGGFALQYYEEVQKVQKTISLDNLAQFKAKCDETYAKVGEGGITLSQVIAREETLPTATADSPDFVEVGGVLYRKKAVDGGVTGVVTSSTIKGVFGINYGPSVLDARVSQTINFSSNNENFSSFFADFTRGETIQYDSTTVYNGSWTNSAYRTVNFGNEEQPVNGSFYDYFRQVAYPVTPSVSYEYVAQQDAGAGGGGTQLKGYSGTIFTNPEFGVRVSAIHADGSVTFTEDSSVSVENVVRLIIAGELKGGNSRWDTPYENDYYKIT